jgi:bifunctional non-homologous end joining protein LigD
LRDQRHHRPDDGRDRAGEDVWRPTAAAERRPRRSARRGGAAAVPAAPARHSGRRGSGRRSWIHEYKYDGYRLLLAIGDGVATAWTRNGKDWSDKFKALVKAARSFPPAA